MKIINADVYCPDGEFRSRDIYIEGEKFAAADGDSSDESGVAAGYDGGKSVGGDEVIDGAGCYAIPGLIDIHFHGAMGLDVCDGKPEAFEEIGRYELTHGITAMCPATLTLPVEDLSKVLALGAEFASKEHSDCADLIGFNMEGPFISREKKGAQNAEYILPCNAVITQEFLESSKGLLKIIGLAPEANPGFEDYIKSVKDKVVVSLAHTNTDYETAMKAFDAGASHVVHLYNAMTGLTHRAPGLVGAAFDYGKATCEIICDGMHIHPAAVRAAFRLMGAENMILVSDTLRCCGMEDGEYELGGQPVIKEGRICRLKEEGNIAGSVSNLFDCLRTAVLDMDIPLARAVASCTINPARRIGADKLYGSIEPGKFADLLLVDKESFELKKVIKRGQ